MSMTNYKKISFIFIWFSRAETIYQMIVVFRGGNGQSKIEHRELEFEDNETENDDGVCNENEIVVDVCKNHYNQFSKL